MEPDRSRLGKVLTTLGYGLFIFSIVGRGFGGEAAGALFFPAIILIFAGRASTRRARRTSSGETAQESGPRPPEPRRPQPADPRPPRQRAETKLPDRAKVQADLEEALGAFRVGDDDEPASVEPVVIDTGDSRRKTSAEMVEEARRKFNKTS